MRAVFVFLFVGLHSAYSQAPREPSVPCYDDQNRAQRCQPPFVNAAYGRIIVATNTCGVKQPIEYCLQTGVTGAKKYCYVCDDREQDKRHPPEFLSDFNNNTRWTWWQSETMLEGMQYPTVVNLTLHLGKSFDITYVNLRFYSPRPESFAIYKRTTENGPWIPYQFYSASCEKTYSQPRRGIITASDEDKAICTNEFSDISPLTGGSVAFSTLEGRPSMFEFLSSPKLQVMPPCYLLPIAQYRCKCWQDHYGQRPAHFFPRNFRREFMLDIPATFIRGIHEDQAMVNGSVCEWVTATDIRIVLTRMNTFGDEVFGDAQVLKSYFYAISDLAVGARCKCNGHARECQAVRGQDLRDRLVCVCEHFTTGPDCERCLPFYNDRPWGRATEVDVNECKACNCNGLSDRCEFDPELYRQTGHGGRCTDCRDNTDGVNCELCKDAYYRKENQCLSCGCHPTGSRHQQCDNTGQCPCKPGVGGTRCDRCLPNYYDFGENGCTPCACVPAGSYKNEPRCDSRTGLCSCKENVDGRRCDKCKPGFFGLSELDPFGCIACFCYGHSSECSSASGFYADNITSNFETGNQRWKAGTRDNREAETQYNGVLQNLGVSADANEYVYLVAPARYLGDQRYSYNQFLTFDLRIGEESPKASTVDVIFEGSGQSFSTHIYAQNNPAPRSFLQSYAFRIHEDPAYQWTPRLTSKDYIAVLANLTAIKIRATYSNRGVGFFDNIKLGTARQGFQLEEEASWVESCTCPTGYIGQFCESCVQGYKRDPPNGGPFAKCVPCECNGHSESCDVNTGRCICQDNTEGNFCENCARGFYGDATKGTPGDCTPCPCPNGGPCIQLMNGDVVCTECEQGYGGNLCDVCLDGFYGDPVGYFTGRPSGCRKCTCNGNIDPNAVGNCNTTTGECLKCIRNTGGFYCDQCLPNYYNNTNGLCTACNCYSPGTVSQPGTSGCDQKTGQCLCLPNVVGRQCEQCEIGYWNIASGEGCSPCQCSPVGSLNYTCDESTGQCQCKPGVTGRTCETCGRYFYGFSPTGCSACNCDPVGSTDLQCDAYGYCPCKENVDGRRCDRCMENKFDIRAGCLDCPQCYDLVLHQVTDHRSKLRELTSLINKTTDNPSLFNDTKFVSYLSQVNSSINDLLRDARGASTGDGTVGQQLDNLKKSLNDVVIKAGEISRNIGTASKASQDSQNDITSAEKAIENAEMALKNAENYIDKEGRTALRQALEALANFGQNSNQMTEIARNATALAKKQTEDAQMIENLARNALDTSREAYRLANESLSMPLKTQQEIDRLRREYDDASLLFQSTKALANNTLTRATTAREEAFSVYRIAQEQLPSVDFDTLKKEADRILFEAEDIKRQAQELIKENEELLNKVNNQTAVANDLLNQGASVNSEIAELLAEVDYAKSEAESAVLKAINTLKEANETLKTLEDFEKLMNNKDAADKALAEIPAITKIINDARDMTKEAVNALKGVDSDARRALELARQAEQKAIQASEEAGNIRNNAGETKEKASQLRQDAESLSGEVKTRQATVDDYDAQVSKDEELAKTALKEAAEAKQKAQDAWDQVSAVHKLIQSINIDLDDHGPIDLSRLEYLEKQLLEVERQINESSIERNIEALIRKNSLIEEQVSAYELDLSELRAAVENIGDIKESLPDNCFKTVPLEAPK